MEFIDYVLQTIPNLAFAALGYWLGWRIYNDTQKRIDYLISVIIALCGDETAKEIRAQLQEM